jgi:D-tyrosyl-tRNA(Tyr) deacylase
VHALLQRVVEAAVSVDSERVASIGPGLLIFVGVFPADTTAIAERLADRALDLRIFPDSAKPMNRSVIDVGGEVLVVSQFTLAADTTRGRRPSFDSAAPPEQAERLYLDFVQRVRARVGRVATGRFGAEMKVSLVNDGPVTFLLD